jgi:anti-sigma B factor antagonist
MSTPAGQSEVHDLVISASSEHGRHRLLLTGELDLASAWNLVEAVSRACSEGAKEMVLDITPLDFIDSTGLRAILRSRSLCAESGCEMRIAPEAEQIKPQVRRLFQVTGLVERLPFGPADAG